MATEGIRKVKVAEEAAEDMIDAAADQADRILADGRVGTSRKIALAEDRARGEIAEVRQRYDKETAEEILVIEAAAIKERDRVSELARMHIEEATRVVLEVVEQ